jgi:hypothetical protein
MNLELGDPFDHVLDGILDRREVAGSISEFAQSRIESRGFTCTGRADAHDQSGSGAHEVTEAAFEVERHSQFVEPTRSFVDRSETQHGSLSQHGRDRGESNVYRSPGCRGPKLTVLGASPFDEIDLGEDLEASQDCAKQVLIKGRARSDETVDSPQDLTTVLAGIEMNIRSPSFEGLVEEVFDLANRRWVFGGSPGIKGRLRVPRRCHLHL